MNWERVRLGDIVNIRTGKLDANAAVENGEFPFFTCAKEISRIDNYAFDGECVLVAGNGDLNVKYYNGKFNAYQRTYVIQTSNETLDIKYLYYFLEEYLEELRIKSIGGVIKYIKLENLQEPKIPLPPLSVQKEIVEKLDKAAVIREKSKALLTYYDALAESLFIELFGDPISNEKGWEVGVLDNVAPIKKYDKDIEPDNDGKFWLLNLDMIESNTGEIIDKNMVDISEINTSTIKFSEKNVLYSKLRPYLNKVVTPIEKGYCTTELLPLFPDENILDRNFLTYLLRSVSFVKYIEEKVAGAKMPRVNMDTLRRFNIILPPLSLQIKFAEMVENIEEQKARAKAEIEQSEAVFQALLQESFG